MKERIMRIIKVIGKWFIVKLENQYFDIILYSAVRKAFIIKARNALMCGFKSTKRSSSSFNCFAICVSVQKVWCLHSIALKFIELVYIQR
jgi:hypothetical protein